MRHRFSRRKLLKYQLCILLILLLCSGCYSYMRGLYGQSNTNDGYKISRELFECSSYCDPYGGPISITGAMVGQVRMENDI